jgi:hypothetical protein
MSTNIYLPLSVVKSASSFSKNLRTAPFSRICKYFSKKKTQDKLKTKEVKSVNTGKKENMLEVIDKCVCQGTTTRQSCVSKSIFGAVNNNINAIWKGLDGEFQ